jgi:hypothetical protein
VIPDRHRGFSKNNYHVLNAQTAVLRKRFILSSVLLQKIVTSDRIAGGLRDCNCVQNQPLPSFTSLNIGEL